MAGGEHLRGWEITSNVTSSSLMNTSQGAAIVHYTFMSHPHILVLEALLPVNWRRCEAAKAENTQLLWQMK